MRLLNIGERTFITAWGKWEPMAILEIPDNKAQFYLNYAGEVKVLEEVKAEVENAPVVTSTKKTKKSK